jgi:hypothetical protein
MSKPQKHGRYFLHRLIADPHGGVTRSTHMWLRSFGKRARVGRDATVYGAHSPRVFGTHHGACMPYACVRCEADAFQKGLSALERAHTAGAKAASTSCAMCSSHSAQTGSSTDLVAPLLLAATAYHGHDHGQRLCEASAHDDSLQSNGVVSALSVLEF